jgi:hypothetical protein
MMQRAYATRDGGPLPENFVIHASPAQATSLVGRIVEHGLSDELHDRRYLILEAVDGRSHYVGIEKGEGLDALGTGMIVKVDPAKIEPRETDRTVARIAAANGGRYDVDAHLRQDPSATEEFARIHVRRLEAIRRLTGGVERMPDRSWMIANDHVERAAVYEVQRAKDRPLQMTIPSSQPIERLIGADARTWLDDELVAPEPLPLRDAGFGRVVHEA